MANDDMMPDSESVKFLWNYPMASYPNFHIIDLLGFFAESVHSQGVATRLSFDHMIFQSINNNIFETSLVRRSMDKWTTTSLAVPHTYLSVLRVFSRSSVMLNREATVQQLGRSRNPGCFGESSAPRGLAYRVQCKVRIKAMDETCEVGQD